jgi:hypothetical protein
VTVSIDIIIPVALNTLSALGTHIATDWVAAQAYERRLRDLEANDEDYAKNLSNARKRENEMRRIADAKITKRIVSCRSSLLIQW